MSFARDVYTATEEQTDFTITFPYISDTHVLVYQEGSLLTVETDYTIVAETTVRLTTEATAGDTVVVQRSTSQSTRLVDYASASSLTEEDLDNDSLQALYLVQEAIDAVALALGVDANDLWDAEGVRLTEVGAPTAASDAATKEYVDDVLTEEGNLPASTEAEDGDILAVTTEGAVDWIVASSISVADNSINTEHLVNEAVTGAIIEDGSVNTEHFTAEAVNTAAIENATITLAKMTSAEGTEGQLLKNEEGTSVVWATVSTTDEGEWTYGAAVELTGTTIDLAETIEGDTITEIEIIFNGVSSNTNAESAVVRLGDSGGLETDGYVTSTNLLGETGVGSTEGFPLINNANWTAAENYTGVMRLTRWDPTAHLWIMESWIQRDDAALTAVTHGQITLDDELTDIAMSLEGGVDTFDAGDARVRYR